MSRHQAGGADPRPPFVCYCWSFTEAQIVEDVREHGRSTIREYIQEQVRAGRCACETKNPSGRCCLGAVGRVIRRTIGGDPDRSAEAAD
jgi:hypothetical protein